MDDKIVVTIFDNEKNAYEGSRALNDLHAEGSITLYASAVIAKDAAGKVSVKQMADPGPMGTGLGLVTGTLIGLLGGPVGVAVGATAGTLGGILYDSAEAGVGEDFLEEVGKQMTPGKVAVVAEVQEEWIMPLDTRMEAAGGVVIRRARGEALDAQIERDVDVLKAELADLKTEHTLALWESKPKLEEKIDAAKARLQKASDRVKTATEATEKEMEAKVKALKEQAANAKGDTKSKLEARTAEVQSEYKKRVKKLHQAWETTKEALS